MAFGAKGAGKTRNLLKEILKLTLLPRNAGFSLVLFDTNTPQDVTLNSIKPLIEKKLQVRVVSYEEVEETLKLLFQAKIAYNEVIQKNLAHSLTAESRNKILSALGATDFSQKVVYSIVVLDDCMNMMLNPTGSGGVHGNKNSNNFLKQSLLRSRQTCITYILTLQDPKGIATEMKANADSVWIFGGLPYTKIMNLFRQLPHIYDPERCYGLYRRLKKNDAMIFFFLADTTIIRIIRCHFQKGAKTKKRGQEIDSVMIETEELTTNPSPDSPSSSANPLIIDDE
jgi:hypothetical protein